VLHVHADLHGVCYSSVNFWSIFTAATVASVYHCLLLAYVWPANSNHQTMSSSGDALEQNLRHLPTMPATSRMDEDVAAGCLRLDGVHSPTPSHFLSVCPSIFKTLLALHTQEFCDISPKLHNYILLNVLSHDSMVYLVNAYEFCH